MPKVITFVLALAATVPAAGCLQRETRHVLYLAPDGALAWMTTESDVHSDEGDAGKRWAEEQEYLSAARSGTHRMGQGLSALGPLGTVRTHIVRAERPFTVITEAGFEAVDRTLQRLFTENGLHAESTLRRAGVVSTLHIRFDFSGYVELDSPAAALLEDFEHLSLVLTEGTFIESDGFTVTGNGRAAAISPLWIERAEAAFEAKGAIELWIAWARE